MPCRRYLGFNFEERWKNGSLDSQKEVKTVKNIRNDRKGVLKISTNTEKGYEGSVKRSKGKK